MTDSVETLAEELRELRPRPLTPEKSALLRRVLAAVAKEHPVHGAPRSPVLRWALAAAAVLLVTLTLMRRFHARPAPIDPGPTSGLTDVPDGDEYIPIAFGRAVFAAEAPRTAVTEAGERLQELRFRTVDHYRFRHRGDGHEVVVTLPGEERRLVSYNSY